MVNLHKNLLLTSSLLLTPIMAVKAQQFSIAAGTITTCAGVLEDTGGPNGAYGDNENFTVVICADNPGDGISLNWIVANLSTAGPNNNLDRIRIWDGDNTGETFLGEYTGNGLQGLIVSATTFNTTGCLTVQFISNNVAGPGNFAASITCFTPCERPIAVASMSEAVPALVCVGENIAFDGTASYAAAGFNIVSYEWDFDDGTTAGSSTATHAFDVPGEYIVQLNLIDDNDCVNANVVDLQVLVSTTPSFQGTVESVELCLGATVDLNAVVTPITWTGIPDANFGDGVFLPDDVGQPFTSSLSFTQFEPGQTLTDCNDLLDVCVEMEHTFMGDLVLQITCPNGQTTILHQQGGGGTYLGSPNDGDSNANPIPGECWTYCWSESATNGTWVDNSNQGSQNTTSAGTPASQSLNPGTYEPVESLCNLVGCPLNGEWTYTSTDLWGADNGFICSWSINFNPAIIPDVTQFTPDVGTNSLDSAFWTGPFLEQDPNDPLSGTATPDVQGDYAYTFFVTDNFGCVYDTTITVTVPPQITLDAGPDLVLCTDPEPMAGVITANGPPTNCLWDLVLFDAAWDSWNGGANLVVNIDGVNTTYTLPGGTNSTTYPINVQSGQTITLTYTAGTIWNNENSFDLINDVGVEVYSSPNGPATGVLYTGTMVCGGGATPFFFEWTPTTGLTDPNSATSDVYVTEPTMFYLTSYPVGYPECGVVDSVLVSPDPSIDAGISNVLTMCASDPMILLTDSLGGTPDLTGIWTMSDGTQVPNLFDPAVSITDIYTYTVTSAAGCVATASLDITIIPADDPTCCGVPDAGEPMLSCDLTIALSATPGNTGVGEWRGPTGAVFADPLSPQTTVTMPTGGGGSHMFYWEENDGAFCNTVDSVLMTFTDAFFFTPTLTDALCFGYCDGAADIPVSGGNSIAGLNYEWSNGEIGVDLTMIDGLCAGEHMLRVRDDNNCTDSLIFTISEPILLEIDSMATQPVTCSGDCDGQVEVYDPEAVQYSYDDGASWSADAQLADACEGLYQVQIQDMIGCIGRGSIQVTGPPPVIAEFTWGPDPANVNDPNIRFGNLSSDAIRYFWNFDDLATSTEVNPSFTFSEKEPGIYEVCLVAYNFNDCADTICHNVIIDDVLFTYIPNSFTPDGDGVNDFWGMSANIAVITDFEMLVFDRWGQIVYSTENPYKPWFGSYQNDGEILKSDVYAYRITYAIEGTEARKEILGHVTLLK
ncbi:MAG: gliding motility-associated C-terminal domain-containing protein [Flavobacteriales bacterium]|nr:gliding motility-associated C-terminal domain-containing protein [Flavobacteriales bacterium]